MAMANGPASVVNGRVGRTGEKLFTEPPLRMKLRRARTASVPIFDNVKTFCTIAPSFTPKQLINVRRRMEAMATTLIATGFSGKKYPRYVAEVTATAAIEAVLMTANAVQPYRNPTSGLYASRR